MNIQYLPWKPYPMPPSRPDRWPRAILLVDMNAFFASIEQQDFQELRGRPVAVTNGLTGTCIITSSYEARACGISTGMHIKEGRRLCPDLVQRPARPHRYVEVSTAIMAALGQLSPDVEVFSVDEAFLDVTGCQDIYGSPERMGLMAKQIVFDTSGLLCSIGVSGDKTTAKYAAKLEKPDGFTVIPPWEARDRLRNVPVTGLCGIKRGIGDYLAARGVHVCGDMVNLPISELARRFGNPGRRIWFMAQGLDPDKVHTTVAAPKQVGASKVLPPATRDREVLTVFLQHMAELVAMRMRQHGFEALTFDIGLLTELGWVGGRYKAPIPTADGHTINQFCLDLMDHWEGQGIFQVSVRALDPKEASRQDDLFEAPQEKRRQLNAVMDKINTKYGRWTVMPARMLNKSTMPDVISPSWKPYGHRQTI